MALLFSADHGQEVGHTRNHAGQAPAENNGYEIPFLIWESSIGATVDPTSRVVVQKRPYQTDYLDHTVLGLMRVESTYYQPEHDVLSTRFKSMPRRIGGQPYLVKAPCTQPCQSVR